MIEKFLKFLSLLLIFVVFLHVFINVGEMETYFHAFNIRNVSSIEEENIGVTADTQEVEVKEEDMSSIDIDSEQEVEEFGKESK